MRERVALYRPLSGDLLHPDVPWVRGTDTQVVSNPGDITFTVPHEMGRMVADDGADVLTRRGTLVVVERPNGSIRQVGLVDDMVPGVGGLEVSCGGFSMIVGQSGPWEGAQGWYTTKDPVDLFRDVVAQAQAYDNADLGITVIGDTSSGSSVGYAGSARWRRANRRYEEFLEELSRAKASVLTHERVLSRRREALFKAMKMWRVGTVNISESEPADPEWRANSTIWIKEPPPIRAYKWYNGAWHPRSAASQQAAEYRTSKYNLDAAQDRLREVEYRMEPTEELLERYEDEAREEYSLYFWQNHDPGKVVQDLAELGPFEFRERPDWDGDRPRLQLEVGVPRVGVRRPELHLEIGFNVRDLVFRDAGEVYTEVAQFGAGSGSEVLSAQRAWNPEHIVRNVLVDTDGDLYTPALVRAAADKTLREIRGAAEHRLMSLVVIHGDACPDGSFEVGDQVFIAGKFWDGTPADCWATIREATRVWGSNETSVEVEVV